MNVAQVPTLILAISALGVFSPQSDTVREAPECLAQIAGALLKQERDGQLSVAVTSANIAICRKEAIDGNRLSQFLLGYLYSKGMGVVRDDEQAFFYLRLSAEQGSVMARALLGEMYHWGRGVHQDSTKALKWLLSAVEQGDATNELGPELASLVLGNAYFCLGLIYQTSVEVPVDYAEAAKWYLQGAELGESNSQFMLATMYHNGQGVSQDYQEAFKWYSVLAGQGDPAGQQALGNMYFKGEGIPQDYVKAHMWFNLAGRDRFGERARQMREKVAALMSHGEITEAQRLAKEWKPRRSQ